jgi:hypothetical protein
MRTLIPLLAALTIGAGSPQAELPASSAPEANELARMFLLGLSGLLFLGSAGIILGGIRELADPYAARRANVGSLSHRAARDSRRADPAKEGRIWTKPWNLFARGEYVDSITVKPNEELDTLETPIKNWKTRYGISFEVDKTTSRERERSKVAA